MRHADSAPKGWYAGPWNSSLTIVLGYANTGIDEPHVFTRITEVYVVGRGTSEIRDENTTVVLEAGDVIVVEPGEAHTFLSSSPDYFHYVAQVPGITSDDLPEDKLAVPQSRLSLQS
ncbi:MAG: AraC family ligand binding domain-containing protein [Anaerolineae bacterium]